MSRIGLFASPDPSTQSEGEPARYCGVGMRRLAVGLVAVAGTLAILLFLIWVSTVM